IARRAHLESRVPHGTLLSIGAVNSRRHFITLARVFRVFANADDLDFVGFGSVEGEAFPDRVFIRKIFIRERLIHDHNLRRGGAVLWSKRAALEQWNSHRLQKVLAHRVPIAIAVWREAAFGV